MPIPPLDLTPSSSGDSPPQALPRSSPSPPHGGHKVVVHVAALALIAGGSAGLMGALSGYAGLSSLGFSDRPLHPLASLLFVLLGGYLVASIHGGVARTRLQGFGVVVMATCLATIIAQLSGFILPPPPGATNGVLRLYPDVANLALPIAFGCIALAVILRNARSPAARGWMIMPLVPVFWFTYLALASNFYRIEKLDQYLVHTLIPLPLAVLLSVLLAGLIASQPGEGFMAALSRRYMGGIVARIAFPVVLITPFTVGLFRIHVIRTSDYDLAAAFSQFATTNIVIFGAFIWLCAHMLNRVDARRQKVMDSLQETNRELSRVNAALECKITEQERTEEARQKTELQLFQSQKMEAMGTLAAGIAHDFNNLLTVIMLNTENALEAAPADSPLRAPLQEIRKSGGRAADVIRQIMTFGRKSPAGLKPICLGDMAHEATELLRHALPRHVSVSIRLAEDIPLIMADATQVQQVLLNLGNNAAHAMAESGGLLDISGVRLRFGPNDALPHPELTAGEFVRVTVSDQGRGMDPETMTKIFDPFFTTKPPGQGTGLGLSVVHGIMQLHQGCVTVKSEPGRGSRFNLYFPIAESV